MKISQAGNPPTPGGEKAAAQMKGMNIMMPLVSLYICFIMPAALGVYWIFNSVLAVIQDVILNKFYKKKMDAEDAERQERYRMREAELERKRQETDRLKAEGLTQRNENTSKKKLQAKQKAELDELKAAAVREERAKRREKLGIVEEEKPASQVGNRRYARGRAYVPDRFTNPEHAAEATAAAAAESELGSSIDETVEPETEVRTAEVQSAETVIADSTADIPADEAPSEADETECGFDEPGTEDEETVSEEDDQ